MTDQEFIEMEPSAAAEYWLAADDREERLRLHKLYVERRGVSLSKLAGRADEAPGDDATNERPSEASGVSLVGLGWLLMVAGIVGAFIGGFNEYPLFWLIALSSVAMSAGFFCALFGWIGKKLDLIATRLDR